MPLIEFLEEVPEMWLPTVGFADHRESISRPMAAQCYPMARGHRSKQLDDRRFNTVVTPAVTTDRSWYRGVRA